MQLKLLRLWLGPLPKEEIFPESSVNPFIFWVVHPLKRRLARIYLLLLQKIFKLKVIAVGGSNGKTTTRTLLQLFLKSHGSTISTFDSITSTYNIPTSILRCRPWTKYFICEMSVEYIGDMDFYLWLAKPDIAIITLIDVEHTKYFGSIDGVIAEELKLTKGKWIKIVNGNSALIPVHLIPQAFTYGTSPKFSCYIKSVELTTELSTRINLVLGLANFSFNLPSLGKHLAHSLAATLLTCSKLGLSLATSPNIDTFTPPPHRLNLLHHPSGALILDDTYNSNPSSAALALETAVELAKVTHRELVLVLSQMNELGQYESSEHQKLAHLAQQSHAKSIFSIGPAAQKIGQNFTHPDELLSALKKTLKGKPNLLVLFKGSRSWKLDQLISQL